MTIKALKELFQRDLNRLKVDIDSYSDDKVMWKTTGDIKNSAGNLCIHLAGNIKHFIGNGVVNSGYQRDREFEFSCPFMPRNEMLKQVDEAIEVINQAFDVLKEEQLTKDYPIQIWSYKVSTIYFFIHLHSHLNYHLGQINYHRLLLDTTNWA